MGRFSPNISYGQGIFLILGLFGQTFLTDPKELCLIIPIPEPSPYQHPGPRSSKWKRRPAAYPPTRQPPNQRAAGSGLLGASQLSLRTECAYPPSPHKPPLLPTSPLRPSPGPRGSVLAPLPTIPSPNQPFQLPTSNFSLPTSLPLSAVRSPLVRPHQAAQSNPPRGSHTRNNPVHPVHPVHQVNMVNTVHSCSQTLNAYPSPDPLRTTFHPRNAPWLNPLADSQQPSASHRPVSRPIPPRRPPQKVPTARCTASHSLATAPSPSNFANTSSRDRAGLSPRSSPMPEHHGKSLPIPLIRLS
jgi:hypothetical protein